MRLDRRDDFAEHVCWDNVYFIEQDEAPFARSQKIHHLFGFVGAVGGVGDHRIGGHYNSTRASELRKRFVNINPRQQ